MVYRKLVRVVKYHEKLLRKAAMLKCSQILLNCCSKNGYIHKCDGYTCMVQSFLKLTSTCTLDYASNNYAEGDIHNTV